MTPTTLVQSGGVPEVRIAERQHLNCMDIGAVGATGLPQSGNGSDGLAKLATPATPEVQSRQAQCVDSCAPFIELDDTLPRRGGKTRFGLVGLVKPQVSSWLSQLQRTSLTSALGLVGYGPVTPQLSPDVLARVVVAAL